MTGDTLFGPDSRRNDQPLAAQKDRQPGLISTRQLSGKTHAGPRDVGDAQNLNLENQDPQPPAWHGILTPVAAAPQPLRSRIPNAPGAAVTTVDALSGGPCVDQVLDPCGCPMWR